MKIRFLIVAAAAILLAGSAQAQLAIRAAQLYPMTGDLAPLPDAVVLCDEKGKIQQVGSASQVSIPEGWKTVQAAVVIPGLIDARATVGMSGLMNWPGRDQEQFERSAPLQPELRASDGYNGRDSLVEWVRGLGVTTVHTGHAPGMLVSGQTMVLKTNLSGVTKSEDMLVPFAGVSVSLGEAGLAGEAKKSPGTRAKAVALLRAELVKSQEYLTKLQKAEPDKKPARDLHLETLGAVLEKKVPLIVTADRHHDIAAALRLQEEFRLRLVLDSAAEAYLLLDQIHAAKVPVLVHPTMARPAGDRKNITYTLAAKLAEKGIPFAFQSGYEDYVPKTRVVLFEAGLAAAYGLPKNKALAACTLYGAQILGLEKRIGSLEVGKDADLALYDGDPLEYTTHCTGVVIDGKIVSEKAR